MRNYLSAILLFISFTLTAQVYESTKVGQTTVEELKMTSYDKDPSAIAVVLYEEGRQHFINYKKRLNAHDYYYRKKILTADGLDEGTMEISIIEGLHELKDIKGITYNLGENDEIIKTKFNPEDLIINKENEYVNTYIINLPGVKVGSVVEFSYRLEAEQANVESWSFQRKIPKIKSTFSRLTPRTMDFIVTLKGLSTLTSAEKKEKVKCFPEKRNSLECTYSSYTMENVRALKDEVLMPHPKEVIPRLNFRMSYFRERGYQPYTIRASWINIDKQLKRYFFDKEMTKERFFKRIIPDSIFTNGTKLDIAKNIFHFIQDHYTWNGKETGDTKINIRRSYKNKEASVDLIATTLYNALQAADIECYYVAVSPRSKGPIDKLYPNISDFNYTVIKAVIDGNTYFLDAANKSIGFGYVQPFASVKQVRVLDFDKGSYWEKIVPPSEASKIVTVGYNFSPEKGFYGKMNMTKTGYFGFRHRSKIKESNEENYLNELEENSTDFAILDYKVRSLNDRDRRIDEQIEFEIESDTDWENSNTIRFRPILTPAFDVNPFLDNERLYPIDFIYKRNLKYRFIFNIPEGYKVSKLPEKLGLKLPDDGGSYLYKISADEKKIRIFVNMKISQTLYSVDKYPYLKELYKQISRLEDSFVELQKIQ